MILTHNIDPIIFSIGSINFYWYGAMYAVSFLVIDYLMRTQYFLKSITITKKEILKQIEKTLGQSVFLNWVEIEFNELNIDTIKKVQTKVEQSDWVESLHFNQKWLNEWHQFISNFQVLIRVVSILLIISTALILANQTRLFIETQKRELYVKRLLGATQQQLQGSFIFIGFWYGLLGGVLALASLQLSLVYLNQAMTLPFELFFSLSDSGIMVLICTLIGGVSASVATHLYTLGLSHESI